MKSPISEFKRLCNTPNNALTVSDSWKLVGGYLIIGSIAGGAVSLGVHVVEKAQDRMYGYRSTRRLNKLTKMYEEHEQLLKEQES
jgi:hypothetical protein